MSAWVTPTAIDWILAGVALEGVALAWALSRAGGAAWLAPTLLQLAAGAALLAAVRSALADAPAATIAAALLVSLGAHAAAVQRTFAAAARARAAG